MYESHFGFSARPFVSAPRPDRYFAASTIESARQSLGRCIDQATGVGLLIGPAGVGKTLLLQRLADQFRGPQTVAVISGAQLSTRRMLLQALQHQLGQTYRGFDEGELRLALIDQLCHSDRFAGGLLLAIDDAQLLSLRLFEELRWLLGLQRNRQGTVQMVLCGTAPLEETLTHPKLESLAQTITARAYLEPLTRCETEQYLRHQITVVGGQAEHVLAADVAEAAFAATDGIPRLVNQVLDHAFLIGYADGVALLTGDRVAQAWSDLQQMPALFSSDRARSTPEAATERPQIIEFGVLDDEPQGILNSSDRGPSVIEASLGSLDHHLRLMDEEFQPERVRPEIELTLQTDLRTDSEAFADEEIVLDHYAELDARRLPRAPRPARSDVAELADTLRAIDESRESAAVRCDQPHATVVSIAQRPQFADRKPEIVIIDDELPARSARSGYARKIEYRQLFARLRGS